MATGDEATSTYQRKSDQQMDEEGAVTEEQPRSCGYGYYLSMMIRRRKGGNEMATRDGK